MVPKNPLHSAPNCEQRAYWVEWRSLRFASVPWPPALGSCRVLRLVADSARSSGSYQVARAVADFETIGNCHSSAFHGAHPVRLPPPAAFRRITATSCQARKRACTIRDTRLYSENRSAARIRPAPCVVRPRARRGGGRGKPQPAGSNEEIAPDPPRPLHPLCMFTAPMSMSADDSMKVAVHPIRPRAPDGRAGREVDRARGESADAGWVFSVVFVAIVSGGADRERDKNTAAHGTREGRKDWGRVRYARASPKIRPG
ncbi:hypothetical protein C8T65DRAFT_266448 [Cerioporus squamosus]|nr:hypothetical protein C8T65DRAFT_266448 [Cerioporus squamosus]